MSIDAKDLIESYKGFKANAITKEDYGDVWLHKIDGKCAKTRDECWDLSSESANFGQLEITEFIGKEPKDCIYVVEETIDYSKWIGKLCWFWEDYGDRKVCGILTKIYKGSIHAGKLCNRYCRDDCITECYINCRPVRRDEVKFVED